MTKAINNYDKTKISMAHVFLQYDQATMIHKYSLDYNSDWLYITFINRTYRIRRIRIEIVCLNYQHRSYT